MNHRQSAGPASPVLRLCDTSVDQGGSVRWRINGHPARLLIWSLEEWEQLPEHPADAQLHPLGLWCALRLD